MPIMRATANAGHFKNTIMFLLIMALLSCPGNCGFAVASDEAEAFILYIDSYHQGFPWSEDVRAGFREKMARDLPEAPLAIEFMDTKRYSPERVFPVLADLYACKYSHRQPSVIVVSDDNALAFMISHRQGLFPGIPLVFCGVNDVNDSQIQGQKNITGVAEAPSFRETIDLALKLHPQTSAIYSIAGSAVTTRIHIRELAAVAADFTHQVKFIGIHDRRMAEYAAELERIPSTGIVLWLGFYRDASGKVLSPAETFGFVRAHTDRPIYTMWSQDLPYVTGGVMISGREQGRQAAAMAAQIFKGTPAGALPIIRKSPNLTMFNYTDLQRFDIPMDALPANSVVINQPPATFYIQYRYHIWAVAGLIIVLVAMVTALSVSNLLRRQALTALEKARNEIANIINSMPSVLISVDTACSVTQWNEAAARSTGIAPTEALGQPLVRVFPRLAAELPVVREAMQTRKVCAEARHAHKDNGTTRYEDVTIFPLMANGNDGAVIRLDDVTERVRMEEMMIQSEKMLSVGGLAAGMAHEINNPLAGIIQTADVMSDRLTNPDMPANQQAAKTVGISMDAINRFMEIRGIPRMLENIRSSGSRAAKIVANMLGFARKSDGTATAQDLADLIDRTIDLMSTDYDLKKKFDFRRIRIDREYAANLPRVPCEAGKIQQVLLNILRNGAEAMHAKWADIQVPEHGGPLFTIRLREETQMDRVCIDISDNGPGMDAEQKKRAFEPFFTTKPTKQGTGLGLSVSYFIITDQHGGQLTVESIPGKGTTFSIHLPAHR